MISARNLLGREVRSFSDDRQLGYVADLLLDLLRRRAAAVIVQSTRPAEADSAPSLGSAARARWVYELSALPPSDRALVVDEARLIPLATYESKHPGLGRFSRLAAELPIVDEAGDQRAVLWNVELDDELAIGRVLYRIPRPTTAAHRDVPIEADQIAAIDDRGIVVRV